MTPSATVFRIVFALMLIAAITAVILNRDALDAANVALQLQALGPWKPAAFVALWAAWALAFLPGAVLGILGGVLFGPAWGTVWNLIGATLGATVAFLAARYIASDWIARKVGGRLKVLLEGVAAEGWRFVAVIRLVPLIPFNLVNYALGLTGIRLSTYTLTSLVCMLPGTFAFTYLGYAGREAVAGGEDLIQKLVVAIGLLAAAGLLPRLVRRFRHPPHDWIEAQELKDRLDRNEHLTVIDVRGPDEFDGPLGHLRDARNIPIDRLQTQIDQLVALRAKPIVLVCKTDKRSARAADLLRDAGFAQISVLRLGMEAWHGQDFAVEDQRSVINR